MSVQNGEPCNETILNAAFVSKSDDSTMAGNLSLADSDTAQGSTVAQVQRELNSINSFTGHVLNSAKDIKPSWATNNYGTSTDSLQARSEAFDVEIDDIRSLTGTSAGASDLGTFTGSTIADNSTIKDALQDLETAIEAAATFDSLAPSTTKGDIIVHNVRVPVGANGTFLKADSSDSEGVVWASASGSLAYRSVTTTDTCTNADDVLVLSGASFTETLFTASGNTGKVLTIKHNGTSLTQVYTIDGNGSETIGGSTTYPLYTNGETLKIISDGTNWQVLDHTTITSPTTFTPTGTMSTNTTYTGKWWRVGDILHAAITVSWSGAPNNVTLVVDVVSNTTIDTAKLQDGGGNEHLGTCHMLDASQVSATIEGRAIGDVRYVSSTTFQPGVIGQASSNTHQTRVINASEVFTIANGDKLYMQIAYPVSGWKA